jgi:PKD repeat protein
MRYKYLSALTVILLVCGMIYVITDATKAENEHYTQHDAIFVDGNKEFTSEKGVIGGNGTKDDPYIIEGLEISYNEEETFNIKIANTTDYFVIRNCRLESTSYGTAGQIIFQNVKNGRVERVGLDGTNCSITLTKSSDNIISNCTIQYLLLDESSGNVITHNKIYTTFFSNSDNNVITYCDFILTETAQAWFSGFVFPDTNSTGNHIHHNNFDPGFWSWESLPSYMNESILEESGIISEGNYWDDGKEGNYWPDYNGKGSYRVPLSNDYDHFPFTEPIPEAGVQYLGEEPLEAGFTYTPDLPQVGEEIEFRDSSRGSIISWYWEFGDGNTSTSQNPKHTYNKEGTYRVNLTVTDNKGQQDTAYKNVLVSKKISENNTKPTVRIENPVTGSKVSGKVNITGTATDPDLFDAVKKVEVKIGGEWYDATIYNYTTNGTVLWYYVWDTTNFIPGEAIVYARAVDWHGAKSDEVTVRVTG